MASFKQYTASGGASEAFSIPTFSSDEIKVYVDNVLKTAATHYNITSYTANGGTVTWTGGNVPSSGTVRIVRDTTVTTAKATYAAGSSIKAGDLNDNQTQALRSLEEQDDQLIQTYDVQDAAVTTAKIKADNITSALIADDQINSEHYVDGSIDTAHIADSQITSAKIADGTIVNADISGSAAITGSKIVASTTSVAGTMSAADKTKLDGIEASATADQSNAEIRTAVEAASDSNVFTDADHSKLNAIEASATADQTNAEIRTAVEAATDSNVFTDADHSKLNAIEASATADQSNAEIRAAVEAASDSNVFTDADHSKLNAIEASATADQSISEIKSLIASSPLDASHLAADSVTTSEIADAELTTLAGMQTGTASILAGGTALTATLAEINTVVDGKSVETTISDTDAAYPTSGAVVDYVAAQIAPVGGLEVIATDAAFPNTQPGAGVVISIADAGGLVVNGSGTSTTGRTVGASTVTINNINSQFNSTTVDAGVAMMVSSTGSGQIYNYHKATLKEADLLSLSGDINDFAERYRVAGSAPSSSLDEGDLWWDTATDKLKVYDGSAWEEVASSGDFYINTISSYSGTGGNSASFNGSAYRFVLSNPGSTAQQHVVSINGVIQKPNSGTSQPSEGFAIDGSSIIFSNAPVTGSDYFILTLGSTVSIGTPSDNTVATAKIQNLAVTTAKIAADAVDGTKIADDAVGAEHIELLDAPLHIADATNLVIGTGSDLKLWHYSDHSYIRNETGNLTIEANGAGDDAIKIVPDGTVELYYDNSKKLETTSTGITVTGKINPTGNIHMPDNVGIKLGASDDLVLWHYNGDDKNYITSANARTLRIQADTGDETMAQFIPNGAVELYYDNVWRLATSAHGVNINGDLFLGDNEIAKFGGSNDLQITHDGTDTTITNNTGNLLIYSANDFYIKHGTEVMLAAKGDSGVELYYDNVKKAQTYANGLELMQNLYMQTGGQYLSDNVKIHIGNSNDLQIYHDGNDSFITHNLAGSGNNLHIEAANSIQFGNVGTSEVLAQMVPNGAVSLYYDNSKKVETASTGLLLNGGAKITRSSNENAPILESTNSTYAKSTVFGGWDVGTNTAGVSRIRNSNDNLHIDSGSAGILYFQSYAANQTKTKALEPQDNDTHDCGSNSYKWDDIYATNGTIQTSDRNQKNTIVDSDLGLSFVNKLKPVSYKYNSKNRTHYGLIAQDVETVLSDISKPTTGFAGFIKEAMPDEFYQEAEPNIPEGKNEGDLKVAAHTEYGLRYGEFISPLIKAVQELSAEVETLKTKVAALEAK